MDDIQLLYETSTSRCQNYSFRLHDKDVSLETFDSLISGFLINIKAGRRDAVQLHDGTKVCMFTTSDKNVFTKWKDYQDRL